MHTWIIGETGSGKSTLMKALALRDIEAGDGVLVIDPHGETIDDIVARCPKRRVPDVCLIDPTDVERPVGWNPLSGVPLEQRPFVASAVRDTIKDIYGYTGDATPDMDRMLMNSLRVLLDYPGATMLHLERFLTSETFRDRVLEHVSDQFFRWKWEPWQRKSKRDFEQLAKSTMNKAGEFTEDPRIRNVLGQVESTFDLRRMMFERKIILLRIPQGQLGLQKASMFGSLFLSYVQAIAYSRRIRTIPFHVYIDEFHNFDTPVLREMLSGVRKFGVDLTLVNQYMAQLSPKLKSSVLANAGAKYIFRLGYEDSEELHQSVPKDRRNVGAVPDFHALPLYDPLLFTSEERGEEYDWFPTLHQPKKGSRSRTVVQQSRRRYGSSREAVEDSIIQSVGGAI